ncbi:Retrotransposon protein [Nesidiocoris tenuis]|uniref:RNA-directed DNA polymerase n=1 Tax=Nesidiocoris tenuis TaxID=355587 RepID=A0ABN7AI32_9HEMI|nr:Retrotransposon protein [Nesidiocoris tenuis]
MLGSVLAKIQPANALHLPIFDPDAEGNDPRSWCNTIESCLAERPLIGTDLILALTKSLKGRAAQWLSQISFAGMTWEIFKQFFLTEYDVIDTPAVCVAKVLSAKLSQNESYSAFASRMISSLNARFKHMSVDEIVVSTVLGLMSKMDSRIRRIAHNTEVTSRQQLLKELSSINQGKRPYGPDAQMAQAQPPSKLPRFDPTKKQYFSTLPPYVPGSRCTICHRRGHQSDKCWFAKKPADHPSPQSTSTGFQNRPYRGPPQFQSSAHQSGSASSAQVRGGFRGRGVYRGYSRNYNNPSRPVDQAPQQRQVNLCATNPPGQLHHKGEKFDFYFDSGSEISLLRLSMRSKFHGPIFEIPVVLNGIGSGKVTSSSQLLADLVINDIEFKICFHLVPNDTIPQEQKKINDLIQKFKRVFAKDKFDVGRVKDHEAHIKLYEHKFVSRKPYRCSIPDQKEIESQISQLLKADLIEESTSPFASPVTLAYKREENKKNRLCIDFRELNRLVVPEPQPFPLIEELIAKTRGCTWFTALDINSAFWSIPIRIKDRYKTGFVTQEGHWQWKCLPFGLKTSPAIFQRILNNILRRNNLKDFSMCYLDDILIFSKTFNEHLQHLESLLEAIRNEGFRLKITKCNFARSEVRYLGHIISENTVRPLWGDNLIAIRNFPVPKTRKNVRQFLGKVNFYHKYIENSARLLEPLHNLLRKNAEFVWTEQCQESFESVKKHLCSQPILAIFDPKLKIIIETDASGDGVGAVLKQVQDNGEIKPVAYFSKKLKDYQKKKKAIYLECLAMKEAIKFWQHWLVGATFQIITDHKPLEALKINSRSDEELGDMLLFLSQFDFRVTYRPGSTNMEADCLSRNPVIEDYEYLEEFVKTVNFLTLSDITTDQENHSSEFNKIGNTRKESGIIYKIKNTTKRIVISESLADALIKKVHLDFGHIGSAHVIKKIRQFYYTKNLDSKVKAYCQSCELCIKNKTRNSSSYGYLSQLGPARAPFEIVSLDTIGGFAGNRSSKRYLHLLVDHFTRYAFISTSKNQTADDFVKLIKKSSG